MNESQLLQWKIWDNWLTTAYKDITQIHNTHQIFEEVLKIVKDNPEIKTMPSWFWRYLGSTYTDSLLIRIRRQAKIDDGKESISIARLIDQISKHTDVISRDDFVLKCIEELKISDASTANSIFNRFARTSDSYINKEYLENDIKNLKRITRNCVRCVNKRIAHLDKSKIHFLPIEIEDIPSIEEIYRCVDILKELLIKYYPLLRFGREIEFSPGDLGEVWKDIFKKPWIS